MKDLGVTEKEVSTYMYALHAKERNDVIEERNGKKDGSGMSTEEAGRRLEELNPKKKELDQLFENYNVAIITTEMDDLLKDLGLRSSMNTDWTMLDDGKGRYYNNLTFKNERLTTITNLEDGTVEGEAYVNISNSIDWNNVESEKNKS